MVRAAADARVLAVVHLTCTMATASLSVVGGPLSEQIIGDESALPEESALRAAWRGIRVLLVEDNPINCAIAAELLRQPGLLVQTVGDGRGAVAAVRDGRFDLVLMDIQMPVMDGLEATRQLRGAGIHAGAAPGGAYLIFGGWF